MAHINLNCPTFGMAGLNYFLSASIRHSKTAMVWGEAGIGKSQILEELARQLGYEVVILNAGQALVHTASGLAFRTDTNDVELARPRFIREEQEHVAAGRKVILFVDELPNNKKDVVSIFNDLFHCHGVDQHKLDPSTRIIAAGNGPKAGAVECNMFATTSNRIRHCNFEGANVAEFVVFGASTGRIAPESCAYLEANPQHLRMFDPNNAVNATHRSWEDLTPMLSDQRDPATAIGMGQLIEMMSTTVPKEIAVGMAIYVTMAGQLTPLREILADPDNALLPEDRDLDAGRMLVSKIMQNRIALGGLGKDKNDAEAIAKYIQRDPDKDSRAAFMSGVMAGNRDGRVSTVVLTALSKHLRDDYFSALNDMGMGVVGS